MGGIPPRPARTEPLTGQALPGTLAPTRHRPLTNRATPEHTTYQEISARSASPKSPATPSTRQPAQRESRESAGQAANPTPNPARRRADPPRVSRRPREPTAWNPSTGRPNHPDSRHPRCRAPRRCEPLGHPSPLTPTRPHCSLHDGLRQPHTSRGNSWHPRHRGQFDSPSTLYKVLLPTPNVRATSPTRCPAETSVLAYSTRPALIATGRPILALRNRAAVRPA